MKKKVILKEIGKVCIVLIVIFLTYKFYRWNDWKVDRAIALARGIFYAPSAVNLSIKKDHHSLYKKSFPYNRKGNFYLVNQFDITPYLKIDKLHLNILINKEQTRIISISRFKYFNILEIYNRKENQYFIFTTKDCSMDEFIGLKDRIVPIINSLKKISVKK